MRLTIKKMSSALEIFRNAARVKSYCRFDDLPVGDYLVCNFALKPTKYGMRIRVDLGDKFVYLPERFLVPESVINDLNKTQHWLCYRGKECNQ